MSELFWLPNVKDADAPTLNEITSGTVIEADIEIVMAPHGTHDWGKNAITIHSNYHWGTPIKFPTTPETVCFLAGLPMPGHGQFR